MRQRAHLPKGSPMPIKLYLACAFALLLAACNPMEQADAVDAKIAQFHETYNAGDAQALYEQTGQEFHEATTPEQMAALVEEVSEKMGAVESTERTNINIDINDGDNVTVVTMGTVFTKGEGTETFTFYGQGEEARLVGWNVDSPNFLDVPEDAVTTVEPEASSQ